MSGAAPGHVTIVEMAPRDGLQNESALVPTTEKIRLVDMLSDCGYERIEVTSFVSPKWVPQMADAAEVMAGIRRRPGTRYAVLTPNMRGLEAALEAGADEVAIFASASETFSQKNINCSIAESIERFLPVAELCREKGILLRGYVSCVVECPYEGAIAPASPARVADLLDDLGCYEISLGDTIGRGTPEAVDAMLAAVLERIPANRLAGHFHDTSGRALDNIAVSLDRGLRVFDGSAGGLGGCPYAPGAAGNVDTLAVNAFVTAKGFATGLDVAKLEQAAAFARTLRTGS
ncbi:hydroxymethylglutaryl-CoA lyase (plasmid) [Ensifer adhaerens]|uniref:Hydroxymethylglutaryl-CoA lyase n=1 Tax=Ensifer adhaerens TaxID=106592 RepID=A0ABY8HP29_ENSAD|nr:MULTISPECIES: hydroxymethylglutaryl-CoA lyase [Ensifer]OWZ93781.1 hydroxymethylglutaryl-CoA lyase [Sinorhizobium sp. LM21]ANK75288.1 hydroxymethylglutaryl-CoA lyase [Ensifer adhaerens]KDP75738.1 hydroxymethylglutaryl-CoA lyase [Ensifer adhaerens]KQX25190.1 hydroxymethylglutaryl-CoA lyase [Ensifer sp. Root423]KQX53771.1 hydroxymethylglutaryl-CoA lyase [Ensifer sp. Root1298]